MYLNTKLAQKVFGQSIYILNINQVFQILFKYFEKYCYLNTFFKYFTKRLNASNDQTIGLLMRCTLPMPECQYL